LKTHTPPSLSTSPSISVEVEDEVEGEEEEKSSVVPSQSERTPPIETLEEDRISRSLSLF
jgi:hypothetical protein